MTFFTFLLQCNMQLSVIKLSINILAVCILSVRHPYVKLLHIFKDLVNAHKNRILTESGACKTTALVSATFRYGKSLYGKLS